MKYLEIGKIQNTHGLRGEVKCASYADSPEILAGFEKLFVKQNDTFIELKISSSRIVKGLVYFVFDGIDSLESAEKYKGALLFCDKDDIPVPPGRHLIADLIGLEVLDNRSGKSYGFVTDYKDIGGHGMYIVKAIDGEEKMIPDVNEFIARISDGKAIYVNVIEGLL